MRHHAGGFPVAGQHDFRGGRAARRQFGREPDPATVRRHARLDAGSSDLVQDVLQHIVGRAELGYTYAQLAAIERLPSADAARKALKLAVLRLSAVMRLASSR